MRRPSKKRIAEAVKHYRCGHCGAVGVSFVLSEPRMLHEYYDHQKGRWITNDSDLVDGWDEPIIVRCGECDQPVLWYGEPLEEHQFDDWLVETTRDFERRRAEQAKLKDEFFRRQAEGFLSLGETQVYKKRLKELE